MVSTFEGEVKTAVIVADASTKAFSRSILIGTIPIIEFGLLIAATLIVCSIPMYLIKRVKQ